jgi:hypothetical protein
LPLRQEGSHDEAIYTKQPFTWADPCVEYGPTLAYNEKAATEARKAVKDFVTKTLKP